MSTSTGRKYIPSYTCTENSRGRPFQTVPSATKKVSKCTTVLKVFIIAFLGAATAVAIAIPISIFFQTSISAITTEMTTAQITAASTTTLSAGITITTTTTPSTTVTTSTTIASTVIGTTTIVSTTTTNQPSCTGPCICGGISSHTLWQAYYNEGIYMTVNTANCSFTRTPIYMTSMAGLGNQWSMSGYDAIYSPSATSFTVYTRSLTGIWNASVLLSYSVIDSWDINWVGMYN